VHTLVAGLEGEQQVAARAQHRWNSANAAGNRSGGVWMMEYQAVMPPRTPSARSRAVIEPSSNRRPGCARRATGGLHEFGERGKQRTVEWLGRKLGA
jgi:hypothetical protein